MSPAFSVAPTLSQQALRVIGITTVAWAIAIRPPSAQALARRAPRGYQSLRARRRLHAALQAAGPLLAHSW